MKRVSELTVEQRALLELRLKQRREGVARPPAIPRRHDEGPAPVSYGQQRLWFLDRLEPGNPFYNSPSAIRLTGPLDAGALARSLSELARRHEVLRTRFVEDGGELMQEVAPARPVPLPSIDLSRETAGERESEARRLMEEEALRPFDLARGPLLRASLLRLADEEHVLLITMHHIVSDGWSAGVMVRELTALYVAYARGEESPLAELPIQYADYARWQREHLSGERLESQLAYWRERLSGSPALLALPTDRPRPAVQSYRGADMSLTLPAELVDELRRLGQAHGCTLFMTLLAGWQALLSRYTGQDDVIVGTPIAGRTRTETEGLIGFFLNTLALRTDLSGDPTFEELLRRVRETTLGAYAHQDVPFERLVEELQPERSLSHHPLFQVMFALQNAPQEALELPGLSLEVLDIERVTTRFDLSLLFTERDGRLVGEMRYMTDLFEPATVARWCEHFKTLLAGVAANPDARVSRLELLSGEEREWALLSNNRTAREYQRERCPHELFEAQAALTPEADAVVCEGERLSYGELNRRANQLARHLRALGVGAESLVPLCVDRSVEMLVGLLGILKAGAAYAPLDPAAPKERTSAMLAALGAPAVVTRLADAAGLPAGTARVLLDADWPAIARLDGENLPVAAAPEAAAYVIFTSGSTGRPKGVVVEHRQILNYHHAVSERAGYVPGLRFAMVQPLTVDSSQTMLFPALCTGGAVHVITRERAADPEALMEYLDGRQIDCLKIAPSHLAALQTGRRPERLLPRHSLVIGGEASPREWAEALGGAGGGCAVFNHYGPTEATVGMLMFRLGRDSSAAPSGTTPLGRPLPNTRAYVLDRHMRPVPAGAHGELYIGGACVARGYAGEAARTAERFVPDPFSGEAGARLYRTGDVARHLPDGNLLFVGRNDQQVKIRGFRIETGEIEAALRRHARVREALVVARDDGRGGKQLVAYVVPRGGDDAAAGGGDVADAAGLAGSLRAHLAEYVPEYMTPSAFVTLGALPLSAHGKVDLQALPAPDEAGLAAGEEFVAPRNALELGLARIWEGLLGVSPVSVRANFFDLGGHSLLATQLISRVRGELGAELALRRIFERPTVEGLADSIEKSASEVAARELPAITRAPRDSASPLSFAQQRLWFLDQLEPGNPFYNSPSAIRLTGPLDAGALARSLSELARRHEVLRTTFTEVGGQPAQVVSPAAPVALPLVELGGVAAEEREAAVLRLADEEALRPFDLARGPLLRASLLRLGEDEHVLLITMHHIVSDGWSAGVMVRELTALYGAYARGEESPLAELPVQYADYAAWQREHLSGETLDRQLSYWREQLSGAPALLTLPTDRPRPAVQSYRGATQRFSLPAGLTGRLNELSRAHGCTLFMTLLAGFQALLSRYSGQEDVVVGTPIAGRTRAETEGLIGFFVNTLALRTDLSGDPTFEELLKRVRETTLGAYAHQELPFERLVEELQPERSLAHQPVFQVMLVFQNAPREALEVSGLSVDLWKSHSQSAKFDLLLALTETPGGLTGSFEYNTDLFDAATVERVGRHFERLLRAVADDASRAVDEVELLSDEEAEQIVVGWNDTAREYPERALGRLFEEQAGRTPGALALVHGEERLTYAELNRRANQLARYLRGRGVGPEALVGVMLERSTAMAVAVLAVFKAGGAYVPLDPAYPQARLAFMLEDTRSPVLLTQTSLLGSLPRQEAHVVCLDEEWGRIATLGGENLPGEVPLDSLGYVIYTSGSTGRPKGVCLPQRALVNLIAWHLWQGYRGESFLQFASLSFDASFHEMFGAWLSGGSLHIIPEELRRDPEALADFVRGRGIEKVILPVVVLHQLAELFAASGDAHRLREVMATGEQLQITAAVRRLFERLEGARLHNHYGPSESHVVTASVMEGAPAEWPTYPTIGKPIDNTRIYVLDRRLRPVPVGVTGELYIGGDALARGYLRRPTLTAERFIPDPVCGEPGARLYRTGDLARHLPDGEIEYLGRADEQLKVRGFRVEPGEVESALARVPGVREAVVLARAWGGGAKRLVAYVVADDESRLGAREVRAALAEALPEYMLPSAVVLLAGLPLTSNGKVDKRALPDPSAERPDLESGYEGPRTAAEQLVAGVWADVLGLERVGVEDNFFELGGHSLLATQVVSRLRQAFRVELPLRRLFQSPTVRGLVESVADEWGSREVVEEIAETVRRVEQLSPGELQSLLAAGIEES